VRVVELSLRNYRVFEEVDLELPARVIGIFGANGAGKSTLVESLLFALYGAGGARTKKDRIRTHGVLTDCEVRLVFEHGGQQYEVRRSITGKNHRPDAELYVAGKALATGASEVDAEVQRLLHMDLPVFKASVFAEQKQLDAFSDVTAGKRKEMALRLLGIRPVDDARTAARREARAAKKSAEQLETAVPDLAVLRSQVADARREAKEAAAAAKAAATERTDAERAAKEARVALAASDEVRQQVEKLAIERNALVERRDAEATRRDRLAGTLREIDEDLAGIDDVRTKLSALAGVQERFSAAERLASSTATLAAREAALAELPSVDEEQLARDLEAERQEQQAVEQVASDARATAHLTRAQLEAARERLARAEEADPTQPCPTCGRELGDDFAAYQQHRRDEVEAAEAAAAEADARLGDAQRDAEAAAARVEAASTTAEELRGSILRSRSLEDAIAQLRADIEPLRETLGDDDVDAAALKDAVAQERRLSTRLTQLEARADERSRVAEDHDAAVASIDDLQEKLDARTAEAEALSFDEAEHRTRQAAAADADATLDAARHAEAAAVNARADAEKDAERLAGQLEQAEQTAATVAGLRDDAHVFDRVAALLDGFRDHLVNRVGPDLSREAEGLFRELTNHEYDDLKIDDDTLAIEIADGDTYFPIERFSGSESDLANLALRVAISTHLSRVSGADVGMMVLDEVLGSLDHERKDLMVQAMGRLSTRFHQLFVITHAEQVKDQFPASIVVEKTGRAPRRSVATLR
jgi:DNA repair protein SbcC/Rad50